MGGSKKAPVLFERSSHLYLYISVCYRYYVWDQKHLAGSLCFQMENCCSGKYCMFSLIMFSHKNLPG